MRNSSSIPEHEAHAVERPISTTNLDEGGTHTSSARLRSDSLRTLEGQTRLKRVNQTILDMAEEGIYGLDPEGFVTFANPAAHRMTGWTLDDLKGATQHSLVHHSHPDGSHYAQEDCPIYQAMRDGRSYSREDEVFWRKDGTSFPVSYSSTPVLRDGSPHGAIVVFTDITHQVTAQAWQDSKDRLFTSIIDRRPLRETLVHLTRAFGSLVGATPVPVRSANVDAK
ncbi:MAG: PAS domain S-box protein [Janthinobacterium lividum]